MFSYVVHGLRLGSDVQIGGLPSAEPGSAPPDVRVEFGPLPLNTGEVAVASTDWYESPERDAGGTARFRIQRMAGGDLWLQYADKTEFLIDAPAKTVHATWPADFTIDDAIVYLLGPVLGILLRARERPCLHASVVAAGDRALAFLGPAGAGKSTIAAAFVQAGHTVLSDDLLVVSERAGTFWAEPGYSSLRLWPASVEGLYGSPDALPPIVAGWGKRYADLEAQGAFCDEPLEIGAIYEIGDRHLPSERLSIEPISRREALLSLVTNSYTGHLPGPSARRNEFEVFGRVLARVPVRRLNGVSGWDSLALLPNSVLADFGEVATPTA